MLRIIFARFLALPLVDLSRLRFFQILYNAVNLVVALIFVLAQIINHNINNKSQSQTQTH